LLCRSAKHVNSKTQEDVPFALLFLLVLQEQLIDEKLEGIPFLIG
jgi:hypothetical protein